jgi:hypothetical protein
VRRIERAAHCFAESPGLQGVKREFRSVCRRYEIAVRIDFEEIFHSSLTHFEAPLVENSPSRDSSKSAAKRAEEHGLQNVANSSFATVRQKLYQRKTFEESCNWLKDLHRAQQRLSSLR